MPIRRGVPIGAASCFYADFGWQLGQADGSIRPSLQFFNKTD
tara:strand:+ start:1748 stop:1873 length:126 start_codon:yes stop_codon:yes gene_type:complete